MYPATMLAWTGSKRIKKNINNCEYIKNFQEVKYSI